MNFHQYYPVDVINGPGTRCTLFVSGCEHQCRGCYNQSTWDPRSGHKVDKPMEDQIIADLNDTRIKRRGLSLSGGDPLFPANLTAILSLVKRVKAECPDKDIWLWSGYKLDEMSLKQQQILSYVDVLVDGKFEQDLADPSLKWRGSSNQVIHDMSSLIAVG
ncbi:anaerobic ribonucleoside-triphosphate reductase-activating protein [Shewanella electrodiphila]|uniref:Anaerobic ribonucleoside-triphosphate reductase-activating protein n=1 Tax=Shewanella electrodiphila TaxID=934143 RepID=A0ABT0KKK0_9GAMM|nr:anaerobic ribonucleoside-triphosphate reductase-activating protein [Shewanella electrodiphila]MCL1044358.1 anaerobic ribonucleoside-triphosphate reductase-activating protein [Shewanella electrodiphila]